MNSTFFPEFMGHLLINKFVIIFSDLFEVFLLFGTKDSGIIRGVELKWVKPVELSIAFEIVAVAEGEHFSSFNVVSVVE